MLKAMAQIKKDGIFQENMKRIKSNCSKKPGEPSHPLIRERQQGSADTVMCGECRGFYSQTRIWQHKQICHSTAIVKVCSVPAKSLKNTSNSEDQKFQVTVLDRFRSDAIGEVCREDTMIKEVGKKLWAKSIRREKSIIMNDMRRLGHLVVKMRELAEKETLCGEDVFKRQNYHLLEQTLDTLTEKPDDGVKAGLKISLGYLLKKGAKVMKAVYILKDDMKAAEEIDRFLSVLYLNWEYLFSRSSYIIESKRQAVLRKPQQMPFEEDITTLREFTINSLQEIVRGQHPSNCKIFRKLRALIVSRLTVFNARRGGEPCRLKITEWEDAADQRWVDPNLVEAIDDPMEKYLLSSFKLAYQRGKGSRKLVPVLIPPDTVQPIKQLMKMRHAVGVSDDNKYVFPYTQRSLEHVNGWAELKKVTKMIPNLKDPEKVTATRCRHRASTLYALLDIPERDREIFYRHMGHSSEINAHIYQCPLAVKEITKVGRYLLDIDGAPHTSTCAGTQEVTPWKRRKERHPTSFPQRSKGVIPQKCSRHAKEHLTSSPERLKELTPQKRRRKEHPLASFPESSKELTTRKRCRKEHPLASSPGSSKELTPRKRPCKEHPPTTSPEPSKELARRKRRCKEHPPTSSPEHFKELTPRKRRCKEHPPTSSPERSKEETPQKCCRRKGHYLTSSPGSSEEMTPRKARLLKLIRELKAQCQTSSPSKSREVTPHKHCPKVDQHRKGSHLHFSHDQSEKARTYFQWNQKDFAYVQQEFKSYIMDTTFSGAKGPLPGSKQIAHFLKKFPHVLSDFRGTWKEKKLLVKTKVFNERSKARRMAAEKRDAERIAIV
ncbi:uncharacterized protein LOC110983333 isoform X2 [Acanthaster planci]|uniref:Uncharacterized protein LOC110983333 isoform X2 n=1 Tax=Acanthaster planci TaxID=133434 RepID=A0A8B7YZT1_ACAPL|nr:uncharacterized protein LOC110983333 isoform X2 [Acanthaster planci]